MMDLPEETITSVSRLAVRLPMFWPHNPALWFTQVEASFQYAGITADSTKFALVVSQLEHRYAAEIEDVITAPPATNAYEKLKSELIRRVSASQEERIRQVLTQEDIGDRKPSQYLRHLRSKVDVGTVPDNLLRTLWSSRLPPQVKAIIASQTDMSLDAVADLADKIADALIPAPMSASVATCSSVTGTPINLVPPANFYAPTGVPAATCHGITGTMVTRADYDSLAAKVESLTKRIDELLSRRDSSRDRNRNRRRSRSRSSATSTQSGQEQHTVCWYHRRFGEQAHKCTSPCTHPNAVGSRT